MSCFCCKGPIIPGDEIAEFAMRGSAEQTVFVHAGKHFSPDRQDAHCNVPYYFRTGKWSADGIIREKDPLSAKCFIALQIVCEED